MQIVKGQADRLDAAFHIGCNMILNLMRVEGISPEYMLECCFYQFQSQSDLSSIQSGQCLLLRSILVLTWTPQNLMLPSRRRMGL